MREYTYNLVPLPEIEAVCGHLSTDQYIDYCADVYERVEADELSEEEATELLFGPDPTKQKN